VRVSSNVRRHTRVVHGQTLSWLEAGPADAPVLVLVHGILQSAGGWRPLMEELAPHVRVLALDLPGHGASEAVRGDYSLGGHATLLRDLLLLLGVGPVTVVGHSLGGGIAMQFAWQFPDLTSRLVLISSGGLGDDVSTALRIATLPVAAPALAVAKPFLAAMRPVASLLERRGARPAVVEGFGTAAHLATPGGRRAFLATLRSVVDASGQRVSAVSKLYLTAGAPLLLIAGDADPHIPVGHAVATHEAVPGSRLVVLPGVRHNPQLATPGPVADAILAWLQDVGPAEDATWFHTALRRHNPET
jgi:pimeloyl-ACP methyl ester carboxylesterase